MISSSIDLNALMTKVTGKHKVIKLRQSPRKTIAQEREISLMKGSNAIRISKLLLNKKLKVALKQHTEDKLIHINMSGSKLVVLAEVTQGIKYKTNHLKNVHQCVIACQSANHLNMELTILQKEQITQLSQHSFHLLQLVPVTIMEVGQDMH